jgi:hypothetical protein
VALRAVLGQAYGAHMARSADDVLRETPGTALSPICETPGYLVARIPCRVLPGDS